MTPAGILPANARAGCTATDLQGWTWTAVVRETGSKQRRWVREGGDTRARSASWLIANGYFTRIATPA